MGAFHRVGLLLCAPRALAVSGDLLALIQQSAGATWSPVLVDYSAEYKERPNATNLNCSRTPALCMEPFNCHEDPVSAFETTVWNVAQIATPDNHANPRVWCMDDQYAANKQFIEQCFVEKNLVKNALTMYLKKAATKDFNWENDVKYCFQEGLCDDTAVQRNTTMEEMELICDAKYGRDAWASINFNQYRGGFSPSAQGKMACATGNFHCDVLYCQHIICNERVFQDMAAKLSAKAKEMKVKTDAAEKEEEEEAQ